MEPLLTEGRRIAIKQRRDNDHLMVEERIILQHALDHYGPETLYMDGELFA